jgi:hypothetical protein
MRHYQGLIRSLGVCALALAMVSTAAAQTQGKAKVVRKHGGAQFTTGNGVWLPVKVGDVYKAGTVIQTDRAKDSYVDLVLGDGSGSIGDLPASMASVDSAASSATPVASYSAKPQQNVVRVWGDSALGIDTLNSRHTGADTVSETQLDLKAGHVFGTVKKMSASSKYEVKLPNGVAGIRGTTYDISVEGVVRVSDGQVVIAFVAADGSVTTKVVNTGQQFDARTGDVTPITPEVLDGMRRVETSLRSPIVAVNDTSYNHNVPRVIEHVHHEHGGASSDDQGEDDNSQGDNNNQRGRPGGG